MLNSTGGMIKLSKKSMFSSKGNIQLPSINKTLEINQQKLVKSNTANQSSFKNKIQLLIKDIGYQQMSEGEIHQQYKKLRLILKQFNDQIAQILQKNQFITSNQTPKKTDIGKILQVRDRQVQNNNKILEFYQLQYAKLLKRQQIIDESSKQSFHSEISKIKETIQAVKLQIRDLSKTNFKRGNNIVDADSIVKQMKKLTQEKVFLQQKKTKIQINYNRVIEQIKQCNIKSNEISQQYQKAQKAIKQIQLKDADDRINKRQQMQFIQKKINLENLKKKIQSANSSNELKYLTKLKQLDATNSRILSHTQKSNQLDQQIKLSKKTIKQLQGKRNILKQTNSNSQASFQEKLSPIHVKSQTKVSDKQTQIIHKQITSFQQPQQVELKKEKILKALQENQYQQKFQTYTEIISQKQ